MYLRFQSDIKKQMTVFAAVQSDNRPIPQFFHKTGRALPQSRPQAAPPGVGRAFWRSRLFARPPL